MTALDTMQEETTEAIDPITFEVVRHAFMSVVDEMGLTLERAAHSLVVSEGRDFAAGICDSDGQLVTQGNEDLPAHVGTLPHTVKAVLDSIGRENLAEGDIIIMNDPFLGGSHCQDVRTIMPVFRDGELVCFVQNSAHWADAGGPVPGSFNVYATESYGEALYIPPVHLVREGDLEEEVLRLILRNVRMPETSQGDVLAQLASCRTGERRLHELMDRYGVELIKCEMGQLMKYSERLLRDAFRQIPDGTYSFEDGVDADPVGGGTDPVVVRLDLTISGDTATYDLSRSDPQTRGAINASFSVADSAMLVATRAIFPHVPANEGIYRAIEIVNPPGLCSNAQFPAAVSGAFSTVFDVILWSVLGAYLRVLPERSMCCGNSDLNLVVSGFDPRPGYEQEFLMYLWKEAGYGARPGKKDNHTAMCLYGSGTRNEPVETQERAYPIITDRYEFIRDSAGPGRHRGGLGVTRDFHLSHGDGDVSVLGNRGKSPVWGYDGGGAALGCGLVADPGGPEEYDIGVMNAGIDVRKGKTLQFWAGGGGGWQEPKTRPVEWVLEDVIDGFVSIEAARTTYGVEVRLLDEDADRWEIDEDATAKLRAGIAE